VDGAFGPPKVMKSAFLLATTLHGSAILPFVVSTEAYPDFLLRTAGDGEIFTAGGRLSILLRLKAQSG
jgi:hypothetical protein